MQVKLAASTIRLFFAAQTPDVTSASLALKDNRAKSEGLKVSEDQSKK